MWVKHWQRAYDNETDCGELEIYGGLFIAHRILSARALLAWKNSMADPAVWTTSYSDAEKYCRAMNELGLKESNRNFMRIIPINNPSPMVRVLRPGTPSMIGHITMGRYLAEGKPFYQQEVDKLALSSRGAGYYTLPKLPLLIHALYFWGWWPYGGRYKVELLWKRVCGVLFPASRQP